MLLYVFLLPLGCDNPDEASHAEVLAVAATAPGELPVSSTLPKALWSQVVPRSDGHAVEGRFVLEPTDPACDQWTFHSLDGKESVTAAERKPASPISGFDIRVCAAELGSSWTTSVLVLDEHMAGQVAGWGTIDARLQQDKPVIALGDTGCRGAPDQDCDTGWGFGRVLKSAAMSEPALFFHVGDYRYRGESAGTADSWALWYADFFKPADDWTQAAPWVFARGNHERCGTNAPNDPRNGAGWWLLMGPTEAVDCPADSLGETWSVDLVRGSATHRFVIIDTADHQSAELPGRFTEAIARSAGADYARWVHHHPLLDLQEHGMPAPQDPHTMEAMAQANGARDGSAFCDDTGRCVPQADIVGHEHYYAHVRYTDDKGVRDVWPQTLVVGHGGVVLRSSGASTDACDATLTVTQDKATAAHKATLESASAFGYVELRLADDASSPEGWTMTPRFIDATPSFGDDRRDCTSGGAAMAWSVSVAEGSALGFPVAAAP